MVLKLQISNFVPLLIIKHRPCAVGVSSAAAEFSCNDFWQELLPYEEEDATDADEKPTENRFVSDEERELTEVNSIYFLLFFGGISIS